MKKPVFLVLPVTYRCNCRCKMCSIWTKQAEVKDIPVELLEKVFQEPILAENLRYVNLTGGEPFLRPDLQDLVDLFIRTCGKMESFTIASNGMLPEQIERQTRKILSKLPKHVSAYWSFSLDGPRGIHDEIRGREGCFDSLMDSVRRLKPLKELHPKFDLGFNATIGHLNFKHVHEIQQISDELGIGVGYTTANVVDAYIDSARSPHDFALHEEDKSELISFFRGLDQKYPNPYWRMVVHMLRGGHRTLTCLARQQGVLIDGDGSVYHCGQSSRLALGNIYEKPFREIWHSVQARKVSFKIWKECRNCLTNCYPAETWRDHLRKLIRRG